MTTMIRTMILSGAVAAALAGPTRAQPSDARGAAAPGHAADLPVRAVKLYSSGVGFFEHAGRIDGNASATLQFKAAQINDVLKSLLVQDLDGGAAGIVSYPSHDPLGRTLSSFQVDISGNPTLADLLRQLRGAAVIVTAGGEKFRGTVLNVETRAALQLPGSPPVDTAVLSVFDGASIRQVDLGKVSDLALDDARLQAELARALSAVAQQRDQEKKPVEIDFRGDGERRVRIGYVVETPVWKTSYRLVLPARDEKPLLQGWAIVENQTDSDWNDVDLALVSGRPISFMMDLYQPLYVPRPVEELERYASLRPQTYGGGMPAVALGQEVVAARKAMGRGVAGAPSAAPAAPASDEARGEVRAGEEQMGFFAWGGDGTVRSIASAQQMGELFEYRIENVDLPRQRSAMLPIITDPVEVRRLSIYNLAVLPRNPLTGARVSNTTGKHLLQGPITVLDGGSYGGDAKIENVPPGQDRLISFGVDLEMLVDATRQDMTTTLLTGKVVNGVLELRRKLVASRTYVAQNRSTRDRTLLVEHPLRRGWKLAGGPAPVETTDAIYRFETPVAAGKSAELKVVEETVQSERMELIGLDIERLLVLVEQGELPQPVRDALRRAADLRQALALTQQRLAEADDALRRIAEEQNRIRENLRTVDRQSQYHARLMAKLNEQESTIEQTQKQRDDLQRTSAAQQQELERYLASLQVG